MKLSSALIIFGLLLGIGGGLYLFVNSGWYPVAFVNSHVVRAGTFQKEFGAAFLYYSQVLGATEALGNPDDINLDALKQDLRREILQELVQNVIVNDAVEDMVGDQLSEVVEQKLATVDLNSGELPEAVQGLYGLTMKEFRELVLVPQAKLEILEGHLFADSQDLEEWLQEKLKDARVIILTDGLEWRDGKLVDR